jgi:hypothetical protein
LPGDITNQPSLTHEQREMCESVAALSYLAQDTLLDGMEAMGALLAHAGARQQAGVAAQADTDASASVRATAQACAAAQANARPATPAPGRTHAPANADEHAPTYTGAPATHPDTPTGAATTALSTHTLAQAGKLLSWLTSEARFMGKNALEYSTAACSIAACQH